MPGKAETACLSSPVRGRNQKSRNTPARRAGVEPRRSPISEEVDMKNRVFVALLLAAVLAIPAFAQQDNSSTQSQPAATQSQPATTQSPDATQSQPAASQPSTQPAATSSQGMQQPATQSTSSSDQNAPATS